MIKFIAATSVAVIAALLLVVSAERQTTEAVFPGTNGKIAFANFTNNDTEIWTVDPDGSGRTQLTQQATDASSQPAFSADGQKIVFFRFMLGDNGLYTMSASGGGEQLIPNTANAVDATWAPDATKVAFARLTGPADIHSMNLDGTGDTNLTNSSNIEERHPDWSPLGDKIAYSDGDIWVMDTNGDNKMNLTNSPGTFEDNPDWSPDGQQIIFDMSLPAVASLIGNRNIAFINADGTGFQMITNDSTTDQYDPVFSPDGQQIAYTQRPTDGVGVAGFGVTGIIVANADGTDAHDISPGSPDDFGPDWGVEEPGTPATPTPSPSPTPAPGETLTWGDNNCSGGANPVDSLLTLRFDAGLSTNTGDCPAMGETVDIVAASEHLWGDVDCSGSVNPVDSLKLLRFDAGLSVSQTGNCPLIGSEVELAS